MRIVLRNRRSVYQKTQVDRNLGRVFPVRSCRPRSRLRHRRSHRRPVDYTDTPRYLDDLDPVKHPPGRRCRCMIALRPAWPTAIRKKILWLCNEVRLSKSTTAARRVAKSQKNYNCVISFRFVGTFQKRLLPTCHLERDERSVIK
ncbi:hypothetical protein PUN28_008962 [Cardiocondyla obscurior]|uniref:Uncharacterized protein n=1 Tax=Cardiocondyla obscurior TaxID=286306 RepID=A0AAW2FPR6_9HYME